MKSLCKMLLRSAAVFLLLLINCNFGGGTIVTGAISGLVIDQKGHPVPGAKVVMAKKGGISLNDTTIDISDDGLTILLMPITFDTVFTNNKGYFEYDTIQSGEYTIVSTDGNLIGMENVCVTEYYYDTVKIMIDCPSILTVKPYSTECPDTLKFTKAQIAGTDIIADADSNGIFNFRMIPAGNLGLALKHKNKKIETITDVSIKQGGLDYAIINTVESPTVMVDPLRSPEYWTVIDCDRNFNDRPFVSWFVPYKNSQGEVVTVSVDEPFDMAIQFSQPMNSRVTAFAISVGASDSSMVIDSLWWYGADMAYIRLCTRSGTNNCARGDSLYKEHVSYTVTIDTSAQSVAGIHFAYQEKFTFTPKP